MTLLLEVLVAVLTGVSYLRWWRVAQREHYQAGRLLAMAWIWCRAYRPNLVVGAVLLVLAFAGFVSVWVALAAAGVWLLWPLGLDLWPRTARLVLTGRVRRLVAVTLVLHALVATVLILVGAVALLPLAVLPVAELALLVTAPVEQRMGRRFAASAATQIAKVAPRVVAITGSYGKTSTKNYAAHLMSGRWSVLPSPASFNNAMGLSRAVNDRLVPGTDVFVAEMGTYGPGEIAALCELFPPEVSAIVTIGEAHLERMRNRETIVRAKSEILPPARTVVLNVDVPELAEAADRLDGEKRVLRCSAGGAAHADVIVAPAQPDTDGSAGWRVVIGGSERRVTLPPETGHPINVAVAIGLSLAIDVPEATIWERLGSIPATPHRAETTTLANGITVIDDTYNANPDGAAQALVTARSRVGDDGTVWTITPGMVELGSRQAERNAELARLATAAPGMQLCIVGRTNRAALLRGASGQAACFPGREAAVAHVMAHAAAGDVVLYENDLPNHYP